MPIAEQDPGPQLRAEPSIAVELDWALSAAHRRPETVHRALGDLYADEDLASEVRNLWVPDLQLGYPGYLELSAVAQPEGLLFGTDSDSFLAGLEGMCAAAPSEHQFLAETESDRPILARRLAVLRSNPARRRHYVEVVSRVWTALRPRWEAEGWPAVEAELARRRAQLERHPSWVDLVAQSWCQPEPALVSALEAAISEIVVVPAWFNRKALVIDLPGLLILGVGTSEVDVRHRAETERLARRVKALSDPKRLEMVLTLAQRPMTVSELAEHLYVAQPTVSNHMKLLREAGLVVSQPDGRGQRISLDRLELAGLLARLAELTATPMPLGGSAPGPSPSIPGRGPGGSASA
jgi:ArsR family transcriptional regulator